MRKDFSSSLLFILSLDTYREGERGRKGMKIERERERKDQECFFPTQKRWREEGIESRFAL